MLVKDRITLAAVEKLVWRGRELTSGLFKQLRQERAESGSRELVLEMERQGTSNKNVGKLLIHSTAWRDLEHIC